MKAKEQQLLEFCGERQRKAFRSLNVPTFLGLFSKQLAPKNSGGDALNFPTLADTQATKALFHKAFFGNADFMSLSAP